MKYEKINKNYTKIIVLSLALIIVIGSVLILNITKAKYKTTISVPIVNGTVKYTSGNADLNVMAIYQQKDGETCTDDSCYDSKDEIPQSGYGINAEKSYCMIPNVDTEQRNIVSYKRGILSLKLSKKGTKCYLYFDKGITIPDLIYERKAEKLDKGSFSSEDTDNHLKNGKSQMFIAEDEFGESYYFRGKVNDNWVKYGKANEDDEIEKNIWWRIIRINGDGSLRLIYAGVGETAADLTQDGGYIGNSENSQIGSAAFNNYDNNSKYVGFFYGDGNIHTSNTTASNAYAELKSWFETNLKDEWLSSDNLIDENAGFCGDRSNVGNNKATWSENMGDSYTTPLSNNGTWTDYGSYLRIYNNKEPSYKCGTTNNKDNDYYTYKNAEGINKKDSASEKIVGNKKLDYPIGLISMDEAYYAGGYLRENKSYYLYTGQKYWTMSPYNFSGQFANLFGIGDDGSITSHSIAGFRPVINLKSSTELIGSGTIEEPYIAS